MAIMKIRVRRDDAWFPAMPWYAHCAYCGAVGQTRYSFAGASNDACVHADEPCDGLTLALLVDRLRYRQEGYKRARRACMDRGDVALAAAYRLVDSNLDHDLREITRPSFDQP